MNYFIETTIRQDVPRYPFSYDINGKPRLAIHLGKSTYGQCFNLRVYPKHGIHTWDDWQQIVDHKDSTIYDETGERYLNKLEFFVLMIDSRFLKKPMDKEVRAAYPKGLIDGPNNLLRNPIGHNNCIGYGEGTYDYVVDMVIN